MFDVRVEFFGSCTRHGRGATAQAPARGGGYEADMSSIACSLHVRWGPNKSVTIPRGSSHHAYTYTITCPDKVYCPVLVLGFCARWGNKRGAT